MENITPRTINVPEIQKIFREKKFAEVVGVLETHQIEFKLSPYLKEKIEHELPKDVAAIANSGGGVIYIGINESKQNGQAFASSINPFDKNLVNEDSWRSNIHNRIEPQLPDNFVSFNYYDYDQGILMEILIKDSQEEPLFVHYTNGSMEYWHCPTRPGARTASKYGVTLIRQAFIEKLKRDTSPPVIPGIVRIEKKIDRINERIDKLYSSPADVFRVNQQSLVEYAKSKLNTEKGFFYIQADPKTIIELENILSKNLSKAYELISNPPDIRPMGWGLSVASSERPYPAPNRWENMNGNRKINIITDHGQIFTAGSIQRFLDWGVEDYYSSEITEFGGELINNFALVEYVDNFMRFLKDAVNKLKINADYEIRSGFWIPDDMKMGLFRPYHLGSYFKTISDQIKIKEITYQIKQRDFNKDAAHLAGGLLEVVYTLCFNETDTFPYLGNDDQGMFVQEERFKKVS